MRARGFPHRRVGYPIRCRGMAGTTQPNGRDPLAGATTPGWFTKTWDGHAVSARPIGRSALDNPGSRLTRTLSWSGPVTKSADRCDILARTCRNTRDMACRA